MGADNILQEERGGNSKIRFIYELINFFWSRIFCSVIYVRQPSIQYPHEKMA